MTQGRSCFEKSAVDDMKISLKRQCKLLVSNLKSGQEWVLLLLVNKLTVIYLNQFDASVRWTNTSIVRITRFACALLVESHRNQGLPNNS